jgi:hypothetical protein
MTEQLICRDCGVEIIDSSEAISESRTEPIYEHGCLHPWIETHDYIVHADRRVCRGHITNGTPKAVRRETPASEAYNAACRQAFRAFGQKARTDES